jgi:hypothetical protein
VFVLHSVLSHLPSTSPIMDARTPAPLGQSFDKPVLSSEPS